MLSILNEAHVIEVRLLANFKNRKYLRGTHYWPEQKHMRPAHQQHMLLIASCINQFSLKS